MDPSSSHMLIAAPASASGTLVIVRVISLIAGVGQLLIGLAVSLKITLPAALSLGPGVYVGVRELFCALLKTPSPPPTGVQLNELKLAATTSPELKV